MILSWVPVAAVFWAVASYSRSRWEVRGREYDGTATDSTAPTADKPCRFSRGNVSHAGVAHRAGTGLSAVPPFDWSEFVR